jgi:hypothetical protein
MKLRLTQSGYEQFNGALGHIEFEDGVSKNDVSQADAMRIACAITVEWEDGNNPSPSHALIQGQNEGAPVVDELPRDQSTDVEPEGSVPADDGLDFVDPDDELPAESGKSFSEEALEKIADEGGIKKLREITAPFGIKSNSVADLIRQMVEGGHATPKAVSEA